MAGWLLFGLRRGEIHIWDTKKGELLRVVDADSDEIQGPQDIRGWV
jgi:hypothetical protein